MHVERTETDCSVLNSVALDRDAARGGPLEGSRIVAYRLNVGYTAARKHKGLHEIEL